MTEIEIKWTEDIVKNWLEDAIRTMRKLPPVRVQGYRSSWSLDVVYTEMEMLQMERKPIKWPASGFDIDRLDMILEWVQWIDETDDRHLVWRRAKRLPWKILCRELGASRATLWRRWKLVISMIVGRLNDKKHQDFQKNHRFLCRYLRS